MKARLPIIWNCCPPLLRKRGDIKSHSSVCPSVCHKNLNLSHNFWTIRGRAFIFHVYIPYDEAFPFIPTFFTVWPWPWPLTYISENLTYAVTFEPFKVGFHIAHVYSSWWGFSVYTKILTWWPWLWPLTYISEISQICLNCWTIKGRELIFHMYIPCDEAFPSIPKRLTLLPWPWPLTYTS